VHLVDATIFYSAESGGVKTYLAAKSHWLARHAHIRHTIVAPASTHHKPEPGLVSLPSVHIPYCNGYRMPISTWAAAHALRRLEPDLIEAGDAYQLAWAALRVKKKTGVPIVGFYHSDLLQLAAQRGGSAAERFVTRYAYYVYRQFDLLLAPSKLMADKLRRLGLENVRHQPLGVDAATFRPDCGAGSLREQLGLASDTRLLLYAGRFAREKKLALLIDAVERLGTPYHLLLVGSGERIPASARVSCLPFQSDPRALAAIMAGCDALVHPGDQETFGLVVLEAMACGLPIIGVRAGGVAELVDRDTGLLVEPGSSAALAEGIAALYETDLRMLGANGRRKVLEQFDWNVVFPQLMAHYGNLVGVRQNASVDREASYVVE